MDVDLESGAAVIRGKDLDLPALRRNVEDLGFSAGDGGPPTGPPGHERHERDGGQTPEGEDAHG